MEVRSKDTKEFIEKYIDILSVLKRSENEWLTKREKELLVELIYENAIGNDINKTVITKSIQKRKRFFNRTISIYKTKLVEKNWLTRPTKRTIDLIPIIDWKKLPKSINYNFTLIDESRRKGNTKDS